MLLIGQVIITEPVLRERFACELSACKGACCIEGEGGAPLTAQECETLAAELPNIEPHLTPEGRTVLAHTGPWVDEGPSPDGSRELATPLQGHHGACAYMVRKGGIAFCGIEHAFQAGATSFHKPLSCHLYPIRVQEQGPYHVLHYHEWEICSPACAKGQRKGIPVYKFVKAGLIRAYGQAWYDELEKLAAAYRPPLG